MRPLRDQIILERAEAVRVSEGGVHLPDSFVDSTAPEGRIVMLGPRCSGELHVGDRVRLSAFTGSEFLHEGKTYWIAREQDVMILLEEYPIRFPDHANGLPTSP